MADQGEQHGEFRAVVLAGQRQTQRREQRFAFSAGGGF